jgi:hypothetical protein
MPLRPGGSGHSGRMETLGSELSDHPTENGRRNAAATRILVVALAVIVVGVPWCVWFYGRPWRGAGPDPRNTLVGGIPVGIVALAVLAVLAALLLYGAAVRSRGDRITVHERGIIHRHAGTETVLPWAAITRVQPQGYERPQHISHRLGIDYRCVLHLADGRRLAFTSYTREATALAKHITDRL